MRLARTRYNHFAGRLGVGFADAMLARGQIELDQDGDTVTEAGHDFLNSFGVTFGPTTPTGRLFCRPCLDWSERRPHLAGVIGVALTCRCFELGRRIDGTRAVAITQKGQQGFQKVFGVPAVERS